MKIEKLVLVYYKPTNEVVEKIQLKTTPIDVKYSGFRRATQDDIDNGEVSYVKDQEFLIQADISLSLIQ